MPVNPEYGTSRNQARQKLARLDRAEFAQLVIDVLKGTYYESMPIVRFIIIYNLDMKNVRTCQFFTIFLEIRRRSMETSLHQKSPLRENTPVLRGPQHKSLPVSMAANR